LSSDRITGTPKAAGTSKFAIKVSDSANASTAQGLELAVKPVRENKRPGGVPYWRRYDEEAVAAARQPSGRT
jgi:hypothetical protein